VDSEFTDGVKTLCFTLQNILTNELQILSLFSWRVLSKVTVGFAQKYVEKLISEHKRKACEHAEVFSSWILIAPLLGTEGRCCLAALQVRFTDSLLSQMKALSRNKN